LHRPANPSASASSTLLASMELELPNETATTNQSRFAHEIVPGAML
jgi:hypothetical protein